MNHFALYLIVGGYWALSVSYCLRWHYRQGNLEYGTFLISILVGPAMVFILIDNDRDIKKHKEELQEIESESNERHRRWFQTLGLINRQHIPNYWRSIPPPPPISRVERARRERDEAIRIAIERTNKNKLKDFKFLRNNVEDRER
jgi:hypothetical protein